MLKEFIAYSEANALRLANTHTLLAVSGGLDSTAMVRLFHMANFPFAIAHCNFQLRDAESDGDAAFVAQLGQSLGVPVHTENFDTKKYAKTHKVSTQMAARNLRYAWFAELLETHHYTAVATAHHANDSLETMLFNLTKGTGIAGLKGIPVRNGAIIRPMLFATRSNIADFVHANHWAWREDRSNTDTHYSRNHIRKHVVPHLYKVNPSLETAAATTADRLTGVEQVFLSVVEQFENDAVKNQGKHYQINKTALLRTPAPAVILHQLIKSKGFSYHQAQAITLAASAAQPGKVFLSDTHQLNIDRTALIVSPKDGMNKQTHLITDSDHTVPFESQVIDIEIMKAAQYTIEPHSHVGAFDFHRLKFPLQLRHWKPGDWFCPLGRRHRKKLSDFMIDEKIPLNLKDSVYVLCSGSDIVWVVGYRIDDRFKITAPTQQVYRMALRQLT